MADVANHAGTTPVAAAVRERVRRESGVQVGTVSQVGVPPNAANVILGEVRMTDLPLPNLGRLAAKIQARAAIAPEIRTLDG